MMNFIEIFNDKMMSKNIDWEVKGLLRNNGKVITLGWDSKLIGRIFELITYEILSEIAEENGYLLIPSESQTVYPDYNLVNIKTNRKIAIDIKTTYRKYSQNGDLSPISFTLGAYGSFLRDGKKNIQFPLDEYDKHFVVCFLYDRNLECEEGKQFDIIDIKNCKPSYLNVEYFAQEKYLIAGDRPGSGNTENIGSFKTNNVICISNGKGPFSVLGEEVFVHYWKNFPRHSNKNKHYLNLDEYFIWLEKNNELNFDIYKLKQLYNDWKDN